jgi:lipopolysaccharide biosynthesis glycosyltransferase
MVMDAQKPKTLPESRIVSQNRAAQHRRAIFFCLDDRYAPYALFLIQQIRAAFPAGAFDICLVSEKPLTPHPLHDAMNLRIVQIDVGPLAQFALVDARLGLAAYLRAFMPRLWEQDYDRLLYLDADMYFQRGDILQLFDLPLGDAPLAAVLDTKQWHKPDRPAKDLKPFNLPYCLYFNSGLLLIDVAAYNAQNIGEQVLQLIADRGKDLEWHDQTAMNVVLQGHWAELPVQWNYQFNHKTMLWACQFNVCIFHFIGGRKPFYGRYGAFSRRFTHPYRRFMEQHFPELADQILDGLGGPARLKTLLWVAFSGMLRMRAALFMEGRADGDFDLRAPIVPPKA